MRRGMKFNIFYLNFSKVYETKMLINNLVSEKITREKSYNTKSNNEIGFSNEIFSLKHTDSEGEYFKLTETLKVKEAKSVVLRDILERCTTIENINEMNEGDLVLINDVNIEFFDDEETERMLSLLPKDSLRGMNVEGFDVSNFILKYFNDSAYHLKCKFDDGKELVFKIPMESNTEFESKYSINDLLIGKLSIIGIYKGDISEMDFKRSNFLTALEQNNTSQNSINPNIVQSNEENAGNVSDNKSDKKNLSYIDIFAIIQNINFKDESENNSSFWSKIVSTIKSIFKRD